MWVLRYRLILEAAFSDVCFQVTRPRFLPVVQIDDELLQQNHCIH